MNLRMVILDISNMMTVMVVMVLGGHDIGNCIAHAADGVSMNLTIDGGEYHNFSNTITVPAAGNGVLNPVFFEKFTDLRVKMQRDGINMVAAMQVADVADINTASATSPERLISIAGVRGTASATPRCWSS